MSTTEVESVVSKAGGLVDCVVYGVEVAFLVVHHSYYELPKSLFVRHPNNI